MVTGILAVNVISENQTFRDEDRCLRDMEAYGACGVPLQGPGMGMKPQGLPNTTGIPQSAPPGLQVPQAQPPGLKFRKHNHLVFKFRKHKAFDRA